MEVFDDGVAAGDEGGVSRVTYSHEADDVEVDDDDDDTYEAGDTTGDSTQGPPGAVGYSII